MIKVENDYYQNDGGVNVDKLPVGNYSLQFNPKQGFYLKSEPSFVLPSKIYGDVSIVDRWLKAWQNTSKNLGILASGLKGTGKTVTCELFCVKANCPVIFIGSNPQDISADMFKSFMTIPEIQGSIIFFDEYDKIMKDEDSQNFLLSLMDGIHSTNLLFLLTVNSNKISNHMNNRLNRIKYHKIYNSIEENVITEIIEDLLLNKEFKTDLLNTLKSIPQLTMDIITSVIREVNLFNEPATSVVKHLNITKDQLRFNLSLDIKGKQFKNEMYLEYHGNPPQDEVIPIYLTCYSRVFQKTLAEYLSNLFCSNVLTEDQKQYIFDEYIYIDDTEISKASETEIYESILQGLQKYNYNFDSEDWDILKPFSHGFMIYNHLHIPDFTVRIEVGLPQSNLLF